jgi:hypothetical protein
MASPALLSGGVSHDAGLDYNVHETTEGLGKSPRPHYVGAFGNYPAEAVTAPLEAQGPQLKTKTQRPFVTTSNS